MNRSAAAAALATIVPGISVPVIGTVDGRLVVALDNAIPSEMVAAAREALSKHAAFRRMEARPHPEMWPGVEVLGLSRPLLEQS